MKSIYTKEYSLVIERLITARKAQGITQQELASTLRKPQSFVSKFENKERKLDIVEFVNIAHHLSLSPSKIVKDLELKLNARGRSKDGGSK